MLQGCGYSWITEAPSSGRRQPSLKLLSGNIISDNHQFVHGPWIHGLSVAAYHIPRFVYCLVGARIRNE